MKKPFPPILPGHPFGRLVVIREDSRRTKAHTRYWWCRCQCGTEKSIPESGLHKERPTESCGCLQREVTRQRSTKHGGAIRGQHLPEYDVWNEMKRRTGNPRSSPFYKYGGRGITMCERWRKSFAAFYEDMKSRPTPEHSIERIDNNGPYAPGNCRWATGVEQANNKRNSRWLTFQGETLTVAQWARRTGIKYHTLLKRVRVWNPERALTQGTHFSPPPEA